MKLLYSLLLIFLITFCSCINEEKIQKNIDEEIEYFIIERNNHNYIVFYTSDGGVFGMTHDPDCCKTDTIVSSKKSDEELGMELMTSFLNVLSTPNIQYKQHRHHFH